MDKEETKKRLATISVGCSLGCFLMFFTVWRGHSPGQVLRSPSCKLPVIRIDVHSRKADLCYPDIKTTLDNGFLPLTPRCVWPMKLRRPNKTLPMRARTPLDWGLPGLFLCRYGEGIKLGLKS